MKKLSLLILILPVALVMIVLIGTGASAVDTAAVTATVTVQNISVSVDSSSFAYGNMSAGVSSTTIPLFSGAGITATNDGSLADFDIYGANTTGWTLAASSSVAEDVYAHTFCSPANDCGTAGAPVKFDNNLTTSPQELSYGVANAGTATFQLQIYTPNPSTVFTEQSAVVTVQASAP